MCHAPRMTTHDTILAKARAQETARMAAVEKLVESRAAIEAKRAELDALQGDDARHYAAAVAAGWTEAGLKAVGLPAPATRVPGRPARSSSRRSRLRPAPRADVDGGLDALTAGQLQREVEASEAERKAADELTALSQEMGTYDQPNPETVGADA